MRRIISAITVAALALSLVASATQANAAVPGYDSAYAGESAFLTLSPGETGTFTVFFANTGTTSWVRGTASQVDLAACLEDKVTCNAQDADEAAFNSGWLSAVRYTTHTQTTVAPGQIGTFTYNVTVPATAVAGTYRFNGALVLSATGADIHNEGYYQDVNVPAESVAVAPAEVVLAPTSQYRRVGTNATLTLTATDADGEPVADVAITCNIDSFVGTDIGLTGNPDRQVTGTTDASGEFVLVYKRDNPGVDEVTCYADADPTVRDVSTVQWAIPAVPLAVIPDEPQTKAVGECRTYTVQAFNPYFGGPLTPSGVDDNPELQLYANFTENFAAPTGIDKDAAATITDSAGNSFSPSPTLSVPVVTDANGVALLTVCSVGVATLTPIVFNNQSGGNVNTIQAQDLRDTGGTLTIGQIVVATITPSSATNPTSTAGSESAMNASAGEETYTLSLSQAGASFTPSNPYTVTFTVRNTSVDTIVWIVACDGVAMATPVAVIGGGTSTACSATIGAGDTNGASVTVDSAQVGGASITATATNTASPFTQTTSNTATKAWVTTSAEDTAFGVGQSRSGTVTSVEKGSLTDCNGSYILTVGTTAYLITYDVNDTFIVGGQQFNGLPACTQFEATLSAGDLLTFTNVGSDDPFPGLSDIHNITQDNP